jgi:hypothetical protein
MYCSIVAASFKELGIGLGVGLGLGIPVLLVGSVLGGYYWVKRRRHNESYRTVTRADSDYNIYPNTNSVEEEDFGSTEYF